jgi:hypothetical protein
MSKYAQDEDRFDDLELYADVGTDVKINVWVEADCYGIFKASLDRRGMSVTDGIKALVLMYEQSAEPLVGQRSAT